MGTRARLVVLTTMMVSAPFVHGGRASAQPATKASSLGCSEEMVLVGASCVDRYEASLLELHASGSETHFSPYKSPHAAEVRAISRASVVPQGYISMADARRACKASKKRLCHPAEWIAACKGPDKTLFPYGKSWVASKCTDTKRTAPLEKLYSGASMFENKSMIDARLNQLPNTVAKTGDAPSCTNGHGAFDMVGNLNEWVDDSTMRGGFYLDVKSLGEGCEYATTAHSPVYYDYSTGFRCCADPIAQ